MEHRIVLVHGIGVHDPGWSTAWRAGLNEHLGLAPEAYVEVCWDAVLARPRGGGGIELDPDERVAEASVRQELEAVLLARESAFQEADGATRPRGGDDGIEWSELRGDARTRGLMPDWLRRPGESLGDFTKYLVSKKLREAVKDEVKAALRPIADGGYAVSIVSHSWGTVVAHDTLIDVRHTLPALHTANLLTLGSPLWMVRHLLEDRSGRKPDRVVRWANIHAKGDLVGSWLKPTFRVDEDFQVPSHGPSPHSSYFAAGNHAVLRDLLAARILA